MSSFKKKIKKALVHLYQWVKRQEAILENVDAKYTGYTLIGDKRNLKLGSNLSFGGNVTLFANSEIEIGDHTMIGINTLLHTSTHNYERHPMWIERIDRPIRIGSHVWIGAGVIISPGIIVEDFSVIGAGSVVVDNIPKGAIVAGNPARLIKYRSLEPVTSGLPDSKLNYPEGAYFTKKGFVTTYCKSK